MINVPGWAYDLLIALPLVLLLWLRSRTTAPGSTATDALEQELSEMTRLAELTRSDPAAATELAQTILARRRALLTSLRATAATDLASRRRLVEELRIELQTTEAMLAETRGDQRTPTKATRDLARQAAALRHELGQLEA